MSKKNQQISIGYCTSPHGIKGEFSFVLYNQEETVLEEGMAITLTPRSSESSLPQDGKEFILAGLRLGNKAIAVLEGVHDRNMVEAMVPFDIAIEREKLPETEEDEYYLNDLLGLDVYDYTTKSFLGRVMDFYENGVQVVLKIKTEREILEVLFLNQYVPVVDIDNHRMEIIPPILVE